MLMYSDASPGGSNYRIQYTLCCRDPLEKVKMRVDSGALLTMARRVTQVSAAPSSTQAYIPMDGVRAGVRTSQVLPRQRI